MYGDEFCQSGDNNYTSITISFPFFPGNTSTPLDVPSPAPCSYHSSQCPHLSTVTTAEYCALGHFHASIDPRLVWNNCHLGKVSFPSPVSPDVWLQWVGPLEDEYLRAEHVFSCHIYQDLLIRTLGLAMQFSRITLRTMTPALRSVHVSTQDMHEGRSYLRTSQFPGDSCPT